MTKPTQEISKAGSDMAKVAGEKTMHAKEVLANRLEDFADNIRTKVGDNGGRLSGVATNVAHGLESSADYIKHTDIRRVGKDLGQVVKRYPLQSLAAGLCFGILAGRAFKRSNRPQQ